MNLKRIARQNCGSFPSRQAFPTTTCVAGNTSEALEELVMQLEIDVVVAGAVSRGRLERLLIGSTAEAILDDVHCDVVIVKPDGFPDSR